MLPREIANIGDGCHETYLPHCLECPLSKCYLDGGIKERTRFLEGRALGLDETDALTFSALSHRRRTAVLSGDWIQLHLDAAGLRRLRRERLVEEVTSLAATHTTTEIAKIVGKGRIWVELLGKENGIEFIDARTKGKTVRKRRK